MRKKIKKTLSIGIPAFNEESNIGNLLRSLINQKQDHYSLKEILVLSDGSKDRTCQRVQEVKDKKIKLIDGRVRMGKVYREAQIFRRSQSDVLFLVDADVAINDNMLLSKMVRFVAKGFDVASPVIMPVRAKKFFEKVLYERNRFQIRVNKRINKGSNVYACHGAGMFFSKKFYKSIKLKPVIGVDAFTYYYAKANGFKYGLNPKCSIHIKLPTTIKDHLSQGLRFRASKSKMQSIFGPKLTRSEYKIPRIIMIEECIYSLLISPVFFGLYILLSIFTNIYPVKEHHRNVRWNVSASTKIINS